MTALARSIRVPSVAELGRFHSFGTVGPVYEVMGPPEAANGDGWTMRIRVVESGEEVRYPVTKIQNDPQVAG